MKRTPLRASLLITACITLLLIAGGIGAPTLGALPVSPAALSAVTDASPSAPARRPVNVILFIGDGMGYGQLSLGAPAIACMPIQTRVTTHALGGAVTDSAAAATAMATGHKTTRRHVGVDEFGRRLTTVLEAVHDAGGLTGLVTNAALTSATPAAFAAHVSDRRSTRIIAAQMVETRPDVMLGGGAADFLPGTYDRSHPPLEQAKDAGYEVVFDSASLAAAQRLPLLGLFAGDSLDYHLARDPAQQPSLAQMTAKAIELLSAAADQAATATAAGRLGFFLVVENDLIDIACHDNDALILPTEVTALDEAVAVALEFSRTDGRTLVLVTADHETGMVTVDERGEISFGSDEHSAWEVPLFAEGPGQDLFDVDLIDNTDIAMLIAQALGLYSTFVETPSNSAATPAIAGAR